MDRPSDEQISRWYPRLFRTALRLTGSAEDAADVTQQTFLQALRGWDWFDQQSLPTTWLHSVLLNCVRDWARRRAVRAIVQEANEWDLVPVVDDAPDAHADLEKQESLAALRQAIGNLSEPIRQALVVIVLEGFSYEEAAKMLNVPMGTLASRVHEARRQLRSVLIMDEGGRS